MQTLLTNEQMRQADAYTIQAVPTTAEALMERAGRALANETAALAPSGDIVCLCGGGNNGGDGYVCARIVKENGRTVTCVSVASPRSSDCKRAFEQWLQVGGTVQTQLPAQGHCALIIDCIFGTGFHGAFEDTALVDRIQAMREKGTKVLACDIPSGVNGDNGRVEGCAVRADRTLCLGERKTGVYLADGIDYAGEVRRADIGICLPKNTYAQLLTETDVADMFPKRLRNSHKGSYHKAAIVAGSLQYSGAAYLSQAGALSAAACLRTGVGYTTLYVPKNLLPAFLLKTPEALLKTTNEGDRYAFNEEILRELSEYEAVAFGMGMGQSEDVQRAVVWLLERYQGKLILDADALNVFAQLPKQEQERLLKEKTCELVMTPHVKEFSRLSGESVQAIIKQGVQAPKRFAKEHALTLLLKNAVTCVCNGEEVRLQNRGCSGQAKGGSGDVLAGVITGLAASGLSCFDAACAGSFLCGVAAEKAQEKLGPYAMLPSDVISYLGAAFVSILG